MNFLLELCPFFDLDFLSSYQSPHSRTLAPTCSAVVYHIHFGDGEKKEHNINSLTNDRFLVWSKLKAFADDKIYVTEKLNLFWDG